MAKKYEIGGNEHKKEGSEGIADISKNRTLFVQKLTVDDPSTPELVSGLENIDEVFNHFQPKQEIAFENEDGQTIKETFAFNGVGDFAVKKMTDASPFLGGLNTQKVFYENSIMQFRSNKVLMRALNTPQAKEDVIEVLKHCCEELKPGN